MEMLSNINNVEQDWQYLTSYNYTASNYISFVGIP